MIREAKLEDWRKLKNTVRAQAMGNDSDDDGIGYDSSSSEDEEKIS